MPFTISPSEAQAFIEDEAQLLNALTQVAQRVYSTLSISSNGNGNGQIPATDPLRIKMGRRLVYGQLADGPFRHELNPNSLQQITSSLQKPVTPDVDAEKYARKIPAIEVFYGDTLLFREERDGVVTKNEILFQVEREEKQTTDKVTQPQPAAVTPQVQPGQTSQPQSAEVSSPATKLDQIQLNQILASTKYLLNPLNQAKPLYDKVSIRGYTIQRTKQGIQILKGKRTVLKTKQDQIISSDATLKDFVAFEKIAQPKRVNKPVLNSTPKSLAQNGAAPSAVQLESGQNGASAVAAPIISSQAENPSPSQAQSESLQPADGEAKTPRSAETSSALSVLSREIDQLPASMTRQLLQAAVQDWQQQVSHRIAAKFHQGMDWLSHQRTALQNQRLAHAAHRVFHKGHERTGEHSYQVEGCTIKRRGQNLYALKDTVGELMTFKTATVMGLGRKVTVLSVSDRLTPDRRQSLLDNQFHSAATPKGNLDVEAAYAVKTQQVEQTVKQFLKDFAHAHTWNRENGQFLLEIGEDNSLRITDKQGSRGVVFERRQGEIVSKLGGEDFAYFDRLSARMEAMASQQPAQQQPSRSPQQDKPSAEQPSSTPKRSAIEMD